MTGPTRKAIGGVALMVFLLIYVGAAGKLGAMLPNQFLIRLIYYAVVGVAWGLPVIPLITWMNRTRGLAVDQISPVASMATTQIRWCSGP